MVAPLGGKSPGNPADDQLGSKILVLAENYGGGEEAVAARPAPAPCAPTRAARGAHEANHLHFRNWCAECAKGRADNPPPHRSAPLAEEQRRRSPALHVDYAFLWRETSDELLTLVV